MNLAIPFILAAVVTASFSANADQSFYGIPDSQCQDPSEWYLHDYSAPATGYSVAFPQDGNTQTWCGYSNPFFSPGGTTCLTLASTEPYIWDIVCNRPSPLPPYDGDMEWLVGGAYLAAQSGDGITHGSLVCHGTEGHHSERSIVRADDEFFNPVAFSVAADHTDPTNPVPPGEPDCGDNVIQPCDAAQSPPSGLPAGWLIDIVLTITNDLSSSSTCTPGDVSKPCVTFDWWTASAPPCELDFPPGIDGTYIVFVGPCATCYNGLPTGASVGHIWTY